MNTSLLRPPAHLDPAAALELSQQAPAVLRDTPSAISPYSLNMLFAAPESVDLWTSYENLLLSNLRTLDSDSAHLCLERLTKRFGEDNERVMALRGLFEEANAPDDAALEKILKGYAGLLKRDPANIPIAKRRIGLLKSLKRIPEAISALTTFLDSSPTDAEAWAELSDLYISQGLYAQGIYALEEVLLITPYAWNIHARLAEVLYMAASTDDESSRRRFLLDSMRRFCRSIELCDDYLRGYYGLKTVTSKLLKTLITASRPSKGDEDLAIPDIKVVERMNEVATAKLAEIVRRSTSGEVGWSGFDEAEIISARELLNRDAIPITR